MFAKISALIYNCKFKTKMLVSYLTISLIPIICIGFISYWTAESLLNEQTVKWITDYSEKTGTILENSVSLINNQLDKAVCDDEFLLLAKGVEHGHTGRDEISLYCDKLKQGFSNENDSVISVDLVFRNDRLNWDIDPQLIEVMKDIEKQGYLNESCLWFPKDKYIYIVRAVYDFYNAESIGKLITVVELDDFFSRSIDSKSSENATVITFSNSKFAYADSGNAISTGIPSFNAIYNAENNKFSYNNTEYLTAKYDVEGTQFQVHGITPYDNVRHKINSIAVISVVTTFICCVIVIALSLYMSFNLTRRIDQIMNEMSKAASGEFSVMFSDVSGDEIGKLQTAFSQLMEHIDKLIKDNYQSRITQNELKLKALQAQINPHFLYNCLDNLNWHAIMNGDDRANQIITQLSNFYRTSLNSGNDITTVKNELSNANSYMKLQLDLNENRFDFEVEIEEELEEYTIVNLVLQPVLENAINHGIYKLYEKGIKGKIKLSLRREGDYLIFRVRNNGPSIDKATADRVLRTKTKGYGLSNVHERIRLFFGEGYGVSIYPVEDGTECRLTLPAIYDCEGKNESV